MSEAGATTEQLTDKQRLFIDEYFLCGLNASKAAKKAGYKQRQSGAENMSNPVIRAEIDRRLSEQVMGRNEVLARLSEQARGDIRDFATITTARALANHPNGGVVRKFKRTVITIRVDDKVSQTEEKIELELYDAQAAQAHIGRYHKLFTDNMDLTTGGDKLIAPQVFLPAIESDDP